MVTQMLNCIAFSLPLQQFISCFYVIPIQYKMFTDADKVKGDKEMGTVDNGPKMDDQEDAQNPNTV
jgi:hypothetical protein